MPFGPPGAGLSAEAGCLERRQNSPPRFRVAPFFAGRGLRVVRSSAR